MRASTLTLSLLLVLSLGYAAYLQLENARLKERAARADVADAGETRLETATTAAESGSAGADSLDAAGRGEASVPTAGAAAEERGEEAAESAPWRERRRERMQRMAQAFDDPQMRADMVERQMERIDERYADFFRSLQLSPEELDTLRVLMAERNVLQWETRMRSMGAESEAERERLDLERDAQRELLGEEIDALLGDEGAVALQDYNQSLPYRSEVESLASSLSFTDTPLNARQSEMLVQSLRLVDDAFDYTVDLSRRRGSELGGVTRLEVATYFEEREERDARVLEMAAAALSAEQLAAFAERQLAERERDRRQMEFMLESGAADGGWRGGRGPDR